MVYSILDLDDKDRTTVEEQDIVFFLALSGGTNNISEDRIKMLSDQDWVLFEGVVKNSSAILPWLLETPPSISAIRSSLASVLASCASFFWEVTN